MKQKTKESILAFVIGVFMGFGLIGYVLGIWNNFDIIDLKKENQDIQKQYEQLWSAFYDNQERMNGLSEFQREQAEVVIQIADKINGAVVMGISDKEVFEEMKRREAYLTE